MMRADAPSTLPDWLRTLPFDPAAHQDGQRPVRLMLVDDHALVRQGIRALLEMVGGIQVVGEAADGRQALECVETWRPDQVLMDLDLPRMNGLEAALRIKKRWPHIQIVILTESVHPDSVFRALQVGASGYVLKDSDLSELLLAIQAACRGDTYLSPPVSRLVVEWQVRGQPLRFPALDLLTSREREVLQLMAEGYTNRQIAEELVLSVKTVESHKAHMMQKLGFRRQMELVRFALHHFGRPPESSLDRADDHGETLPATGQRATGRRLVVAWAG